MKKLITLFLILLLATFLRFWHLGDSPPGVLVDEASLGYNAYSLLETGHDEWGARYPLILRSFGDFKPAGYAYLAIPFIKIFGLSPFSVRLPSAIFGVISVLCLFLIVRLITKNNNLALLSSFFLSISPWHVYESRMAWEANVALGLFLLGLLFFILSFKKNYVFLFLAAAFFNLSIYTYVGYKMLTPILLLFMTFFWLRKGILKVRYFIVFLLMVLALNLPFLPIIFSSQANLRISQVGIFNESGKTMFIDEQRAFCSFAQNKLLLKVCYLIWNKPTVISLDYFKNYLSAISPHFIFLAGADENFVNNPNHGGMFVWFMPLFFFGLAKIVLEKEKTSSQFILLWLLIPPLMSAIAGPPNFIRSNMVFIPVIIICSLGVYYAVDILKTFRARRQILNKLFLTGIIVLAGVSTLAMAVDYFLVYTKKAMAWDEYYPKVYSFLKTVDEEYKVVYFRKLNDEPYIYMLFYESIEPNFFRETVKRENHNVVSVGKYQFVDFGFSGAFCRWQDGNEAKTLLVTNEDNLWPQSVAPPPLLTVKSANGVHVLAVVYDMGQAVDHLKSKNIGLPKCLPSQQVP